MSAEERVVELIIDASGVEAGMRRAEAAYDHMGDRAEAATSRAQAAFDRQIQQYTGRLPKSIDGVADAYDRLQARMDPVFHAQLRAEREMTQSIAVINRAVLLGVTTEQQATRDILRLKQQQVEAIQRVRDAQMQANHPVAANDNDPSGYGAAGRRQVLGYQAFDIGQGLMAGTPLAIIAAQQGPQIAQLYAGAGGLNAAFKDTISILGGVVRAVGPLIGVVGVLYGAYKILQSYSVDAAFAVDDLTRSLAEQAAPIASVDSAISELTRVQDTYTKAIMSASTASDNATKVIVANSEREFNAKKALLELELKRQEASLAVQRSEMALTGSQMKKDIGQQVFTNMDLERQGFSDPRVGRFVNVLPDSITGMEKTLDLLEKNPANDKLKEIRANATLTEIGIQKLRDALGLLFNAGGDAGPTFAGNAPIPKFRGIDDVPGSIEMYDELIKSGDARLRQLQLEQAGLGLTAGAAARLRFEQDALNSAFEKNVTFGPEQITAIQKQAAAYGELTDQIARTRLQQDAQFEREQLFRSEREANIAAQLKAAGQPIDMTGADAAMLRSTEILKENKRAWEDIRDVGRDAIDELSSGMVNGFKDIETILKGVADDILKQFTTLAVANPFKNALYGDTLPTMDSVGGVGGLFKTLLGGKNPAIEAAKQAVGSMSVTAASVVVNGGVGTAAAGSLLGANDNVTGKAPVGDVLRMALPDAGLTKTGIPLSEITAGNGLTAKVNSEYAGRFQGLLNDLKGAGYNVSSLGEGGYSYRTVAGTNNLSKHSFGEALDINPRQNPWSNKFQTDLPANVNDMAKRNGLTWGGTWKKPDTMHFQVDKSADTAALALNKMATNAGAATQNLGTFGNGLGTFGDALSQFPAAPQGGGGGGFGSWLSGLFRGAFVPNGAQATLAANGGLGLYANGGISNRPAIFGEAGPEAAVPLPDGRRIPVEMRMPRIAANNGGARLIVNRSIHFHGAPAGYTAQVEEEEDAEGNEKVNVTFSKMGASEAGRPGSPLNKQLKKMGAKTGMVRR